MIKNDCTVPTFILETSRSLLSFWPVLCVTSRKSFISIGCWAAVVFGFMSAFLYFPPHSLLPHDNRKMVVLVRKLVFFIMKVVNFGLLLAIVHRSSAGEFLWFNLIKAVFFFNAHVHNWIILVQESVILAFSMFKFVLGWTVSWLNFSIRYYLCVGSQSSRVNHAGVSSNPRVGNLFDWQATTGSKICKSILFFNQFSVKITVLRKPERALRGVSRNPSTSSCKKHP